MLFDVDSFDLDILVILTRITQKTRSFKEMTCWPSTVYRGLRKHPPILAKYQLDRKSTSRSAEDIREGKSVSPDFNVAVKRHQLLDVIQKATDSGIRQIL